MEVEEGVERVLLGEPMKMLAGAHREELLVALGLDPDDAETNTGARDTQLFMNKVCRRLGDRHEGDRRAMVALRNWIQFVADYEAWDALLTHFDFEGKETVVRRGQVLFAGPMTAHWGA